MGLEIPYWVLVIKTMLIDFVTILKLNTEQRVIFKIIEFLNLFISGYIHIKTDAQDV